MFHCRLSMGSLVGNKSEDFYNVSTNIKGWSKPNRDFPVLFESGQNSIEVFPS